MSQSVNILTQYFEHTNQKRTNEIRECIKKNYQNPFVNKIFLFSDKGKCGLDWVDSDKVKRVNLGRRLKFIDCIRFSNKHLANQICAISNVDIWFDNSLSLLTRKSLKRKMLAITRHETKKNGKKELWPAPDFCQDTWIFVSPIPEFGNYCLGKLGCDNRFAYDAERAGLIIRNPARKIICTHLHLCGNRTYTEKDKVPPPYKSDVKVTNSW